MTSEKIRKNTTYSKTHYGSEGTVFEYNNKAYKLFKDIKGQLFMKSKEKKVNNLITKNIEGFITPDELIYNQKNEFQGYSMRLIETEEDVADICYKNGEQYTLDQKIEYLLKVENLIKKAHEKGYVLNDCAIWNFLVSDGEVFGIDTDNFQFSNLKSETLPEYYLDFYKQLTKTIEPNKESDKFQFGLHAIRALLKYPFSHDGSFVHNKTGEAEYLKIKFSNLDLSQDIKTELFELISSNKEKEWIGKTLVKLSSNNKFIN